MANLISIKPMLANEVDANTIPEFVFDDKYCFEQKLDGDRVLLRYVNSIITALGRGGQVSKHDPKFQTRIWLNVLSRAFGSNTVYFDGELIDDALFVFDIPYCNHPETVVELGTPYHQRRYVLDYWMDRLDLPQMSKIPCAVDTQRKALLASNCLKQNSEGVMIKLLDGVYAPGRRSDQVLKAKFVKTADVVVVAVGVGGKANARFIVYDDKGKPVPVGGCSTNGKGVIKVDDVIEVEYLYLGSGGKLVQPRIKCVRTDKPARECKFSQLIPTSKKVLEG